MDVGTTDVVGSSWDTNMGEYVRYEIGLGWGLALWSDRIWTEIGRHTRRRKR